MTMDNCCGCSQCEVVQTEAFKYWAPHAPYPAWSRGVFTFTAGDGDTARNVFMRRAAVAFDIFKAPDIYGFGKGGNFTYGGTPLGDQRESNIRYRLGKYIFIAKTFLDGEYLEFFYVLEELFHSKVGNLRTLARLSTSCTPFGTYAYERRLDDDGTLTEYGDQNAWRDCPIPNAALLIGFAGALTAGPPETPWVGTSATITIGEASATIDVHIPIRWDPETQEPIEFADWHFSTLLEENYTRTDFQNDLLALSNEFKLNDLSHHYGTILNQPGDPSDPNYDTLLLERPSTGVMVWYSVRWHLDEGVSLRLVFEWQGTGFLHLQGASMTINFQGAPFLALVCSAGFVNRILVRGGGLLTSLKSTEQTLPVPDTVIDYDTGETNGQDSGEGAHACIPYRSDPEFILGPGDMPYPLGTSEIRLRCTGLPLCFEI